MSCGRKLKRRAISGATFFNWAGAVVEEERPRNILKQRICVGVARLKICSCLPHVHSSITRAALTPSKESTSVQMEGLLLQEVLGQKLEKSKPPVGGKTRILPVHVTRAGERTAPADPDVPAQPDSFFDTFGPIGILLLFAAGVSACWTVWLIILTISPNETANYLMDTAELDDGHFWLIVDPELALTSVNAAALAVLAASYVYVVLKMTILRSRSFRIVPVGVGKHEVSPTWASRLAYGGRHLQSAQAFWLELTGYYGVYRKYWVRCCIVRRLLRCLTFFPLERALQSWRPRRRSHSATPIIRGGFLDRPVLRLRYAYRYQLLVSVLLRSLPDNAQRLH
jgi:hypothetical protein